MRPTQLTLRAFGPYADEQVFNFDELGDADFFLIHGPTGSGKSTILDAMCFALYGDSSGGEREAKDLRSQYAKPTEITEVVFEFELGQESYKLERIPGHERAKKRGKGTTQQSHEASLYRRAEDERWEVMESQPTGVTDRVEKLLGFDVAQFRQVVMLPQGRFREFLSSRSTDKQKLLAKLFDTDRYKRFAEILKEEKKQLEARNQKLADEDAGLLKQWAVEDLVGLQAARDAFSVEQKEQKQEQKEIQKLLSEQESLLRAAEKRAECFAELDLATEALALLEAKADEQARDQSRLDQAVLAKGLRDVFEHLSRRRKEDKELQGGYAVAEKVHAEQEKRCARAKKDLKAEEGKGQEREDLAIRLKEMEGLKNKAQALTKARQAQDEAQAVQKGLSEELKSEEGWLEKKKKLKQQAREALRQAEALAAGLRALSLEQEKAAKQLAEAQKAQKTISDRKRLELELAKLEKKADQAKLRREERRAELYRTEQAWLHGQALVLARELKAGEACPVCGSTAHPEPAVANDDVAAPPELQALEALRKDHDKLVGLAEQAAETLQGKNLELASLGDAQTEAEGMTEAQLKEQTLNLKTLAQDIERARKAEEGLDAGREKQRLAENEVEAAEATRKAADLALREAEKNTERKKASRELLLNDLPEALRTEGAIEAKREAVKEQMAVMAKALKEAKQKEAFGEKALAKTAAEQSRAQGLSAKATDDLAEAQKALADRLLRTPFVDEAALRKAQMDDDEMARMEKAVKAHAEQLKSSRDRLSRATKKVEGQNRPDTKNLKQAEEEIRAKLNAQHELIGELQGRIKEMGAALKILGERDQERKRLNARFEVVADLGDLANDPHLPFERWVLTALLDDVLVRASKRLHVMSQGRYRMRRETEDTTYGGLEMIVEDAHSGQDRPVSTLSGGEGFMASLALALGLSDVVQSYAGGIHLDTLFIDEGFGSLDPEALDQAISSLMKLNIPGRLVGIISHVEELKQRIPARLEIEKGERGSRARFVV
ncbi:MAG: SMC family ATPase [Deltaproteobacteria bacterium]|nr:SMC family ATPase [Deltaproteobacteria bacterium]